MSDKQSQHTHKFQSQEDVERFHRDYGYGGLESKYEPGYGLLDVKTQFLIKTGQAKLSGDKLIMLKSPHAIKWNDLWNIYESKLDEFNEL